MSQLSSSSRFDADEIGRPVLRNFSGRWEMSLGATGSTDALYKSMGAGWFSRAVINAVKGSLSMVIFHSPTVLKIEEKSSLGTFSRELLIDGRYHRVKQIDGSYVDASLSVDRYSGDALIISKLAAGLYVEVFKVMKRTVIEQNLYFFKGVKDVPEDGFHTLPPGVSVTRFWSKLETPEEALAGEDQERHAAALLGRRVSSVTLGFTFTSEMGNDGAMGALDSTGTSDVGAMIRRLSRLEATPEVPEEEEEEGERKEEEKGATDGKVEKAGTGSPEAPGDKSTTDLSVGGTDGVSVAEDAVEEDDADADSVASHDTDGEEEMVEVEEDVVVPNPEYKYTSPDFTGTWSVDKSKSQSLDAMLALMGVPWVARKVANSLDVITEIRHDVQEGAVNTVDKTAMGEMASTSISADGVAVPKKGNDGKTAIITCSVHPPNEVDLPPGADTHYPGVALGCLRIVTELPDNMGVTDNTWTLMEGGQYMRQCIVFTKNSKTVVTNRVMVNKDWEPAKSQYKAKIDAVNHANARMVVKKKVMKPKSVAMKLLSKLDSASDEIVGDKEEMLSPTSDPVTPPGTSSGSTEDGMDHPRMVSPLQAWHNVHGQLHSSGGPSKTAELSLFPRGHASRGLMSPAKATGGSRIVTHAEGINETDPFFTSINGVWGISPFSPLPKNVKVAFARMRNAMKKACGSNMLRFFPTSTTKQALYPSGSDVNYLFSTASGFDEPTCSEDRNILINTFHRQDQIIICDRHGFGTGGQQLPVNDQWFAIPLPPKRLKNYRDPKTGEQLYGEPPAEKRWCLMKAVQTEGAGDLGANWLGKEIGEIPQALLTAAAYSSSTRVNYTGLKRLVEKLPGSSNPRKQFFSAFPIEMENYKGAQLRFEKYFVDLTVDDVLNHSVPFVPASDKKQSSTPRAVPPDGDNEDVNSLTDVSTGTGAAGFHNESVDSISMPSSPQSTAGSVPTTPSKAAPRKRYTLDAFERGAFFQWEGPLPTNAPHAAVTLTIAAIDTLEQSIDVTIPRSNKKTRTYSVTRSLIAAKGEEALAGIKMEEDYRFALIRALLLSRRSGADQLRKGVLLRLEMFEDERRERGEADDKDSMDKPKEASTSYVTFDNNNTQGQSTVVTNEPPSTRAPQNHTAAADVEKNSTDACFIM